MVSCGARPPTPVDGISSETAEPYALINAIVARRLEGLVLADRSAPAGQGDSSRLRGFTSGTANGPHPDPKPKDVFVGCINPFALAENLIGYRINRQSVRAIRIIQDTLQTDYEELFDMKHHSVLYAGLELNEKTRMARQLGEKEVAILEEKDLVTPDLSHLERLGDLESIGLSEMGSLRIKRAGLQNNKLHLVLNADKIAKTVCNNAVTQRINDMCLPFGRENRHRGYPLPPNSSWRDAHEALLGRNTRRIIGSDDASFLRTREMQVVRKFDDPIQGAMGNSWFVAALFSVYWADPATINRNTRPHMHMPMPSDPNFDQYKTFSVKFYDKGGRNNNKTQTVEVDYRVPVNNTSEDLVYCCSSDGKALWPTLYEKAFAKWLNNGNNDFVNSAKSNMAWGGPQQLDIAQMHSGDPVKAMAQINGREPLYYFTKNHDALDFVGLVRVNSVNHRTICPMVAYTYATDSGGAYKGCNLVANHAYSVLGWSSFGQGDQQYIIVRNPWGVTEVHGLTSYPGILTPVEAEHWGPASLLDGEGVMAFTVGAFKEYFACMGIAK